jgi:hypothetical protein
MARKVSSKTHNKPHLRKGGGKYKWGPFEDLPKKKREEVTRARKTCDAAPFTQGVDNKVTYVYNDEGPNQHKAYVECDYVK